MDLFTPDHVIIADDGDAIQQIIVATAVRGDPAVRAALSGLLSAFEEPYRSIAAVVQQKVDAGEFIDANTLAAALQGQRLYRRGANGQTVPLTPTEAVNLVVASAYRPEQAAAYIDILKQQIAAKRQRELHDQAVNVTSQHCGDISQLLQKLEPLAAQVKQNSTDGDEFKVELLELIPYIDKLTKRQQGADFLGLDSGFQHLNNLANGLDTGLGILAAPPGVGKTTLLFQIACQAALRNNLPVIFLSMEQSKDELRAKALSRLSKINYRHILRGRLRSTNQEAMATLMAAATEYASVARHLFIIEGDETTNVEKLAIFAESTLRATGAARCLICVDYLQILPLRQADANLVKSPKDKIDLHVSALRRLARKLNSPVWAISAENRASYDKKSMSVFKESGAIEYSADLAMVLSRVKKDPADNFDYTRLDLNIIKNRNGEQGVIKFKFYPQRAEFIEEGCGAYVAEDETTPTASQPRGRTNED